MYMYIRTHTIYMYLKDHVDGGILILRVKGWEKNTVVARQRQADPLSRVRAHGSGRTTARRRETSHYQFCVVECLSKKFDMDVHVATEKNVNIANEFVHI